MALTNFEFPKVTLEQSYATATTATAVTLGVACVGPRYVTHRADHANEAALVPQSTAASYNPISGLTLSALPRHVVGGVPDTANVNTQHLIVKDGVFGYFTETVTAASSTITVGATVYTYDSISGGAHKWMNDDTAVYTAARYPKAGDKSYTNADLDEGEADITAVTYPDFIAEESVITFPNYYVKSGNGYAAATEFGSRGVQVGDPIIISDGTNNVKATVMAVTSSEPNGGYNRIIVGMGFAGALETATTLIFCEYADATYAQSNSTFSITSSIDGQGVTTYGLEIKGSLSTRLPDLSNVVASLVEGTMYIEYRERLSTGVRQLGTLGSLSDVEAQLGGVCADNPLALACYFAMAGGNNSVVYYTVVASDDATAYASALDYLAQFDNIYSIVPCTTDESVIQTCMASCISYSSDINSKIRRVCWYGVDTAKQLNLWTGTGTFSTNQGSEPIVTLSDYVFVDNPVQEGDILRLVYSPFTEYKIVTTNGLNIAVLASDTVSPGAGAQDLALIRTKPSNSELIEDIVSKRQARSTSERGMCVWGDDAQFAGEVISNYALAAAAAGMRAYEPPQRPLSNLAYSFFALANTHGFSQSELTRIGSNGIWVIGDNTDGAPCNKRQITTAVANNLLLDEESIISNADTLAINLSHMGEAYVGNSNITPLLLVALNTQLTGYLDSCMINNTGNMLIGPQILGYTILGIWQDDVNLDHVYAELEVQPPRPFNRFHIIMRVI